MRLGETAADKVERLIRTAMAKAKDQRLIVDEEALAPSERARIAEAQLIMKKTNRHYRPVPKFRGGCKDC